MSVTLLVGPVGAGKTDRALAAVRGWKAGRPLAEVWVLIPGERQKIAFRERLLASDRGFFNLHVFTFEELYRHLAQASGSPRRVLHSATRAALLRQLLRERRTEPGALFPPLPGFVDAIARQFDELTLWLISPEEFAAHTGADRKQVELALLYTRYQARLAALRLTDREGLGAGALATVCARPDLAAAVDGLVVDGFDQFNPLHAALIAELGVRVRSALITLTQPEDETGAAAGFSRFTLAHDRLRAALRAAQGLPPDGPDDGALTVERLPNRDETDSGRRAIRHLAEQLWSPVPARQPAPLAADGALLAPGVTFLEAPDSAQETAAVLRRVKALLLGEAGVGPACRPDDILIAVRDWSRYGPHLQAMGARYRLPLAFFEGAPLAENPAVAALLRLLALPADGYRRLDVVDALRTPYLRVPGFPDDGVLALETAARRFFVVSGRDEWLIALDALAEGQGNADEDADPDDEPAIPQALRESAAAARTALAGLFDALELADCTRTADFVARLDDWIGVEAADELGEAGDVATETDFALHLLACVAEDADDSRRARDRRAVYALKRALRGLRTSADLLTTLGIAPDAPLTRADFLADLRRAIANTTLDEPGGRDGRVLATTVNDARGLPHRHVFLLGLSEGIFPAPVAEDPLLLESERHRLRAGGLDVPVRAERADDTGLFYELAGLAGETLTLSRPALREGTEWVESALWRTARAAFEAPHCTVLKVGAAVPAAECAHAEEAALAVAEGARAGTPPLDGMLAAWLAADGPAGWSRLRTAHTIESSRLSRRHAYDGWAGRLSASERVAELATRFGPDYPWSASQLNTLGECGFRFFSQRLLGLEPLEPPQTGMDVLQRGTLMHEILEQTYRRVQAEGLTISPDHAERALALLDAESDAAFARAPQKHHFRPRTGWDQEQARIRGQLARLVAADFAGDGVGKVLDKAPASAADERRVVALEGRYDVPALWFTDDGQPVRVRGRFDRIDRQGDRWLIVDYKSGSTAIPLQKTRDGRNFQMMIYLLALRVQQPGAVVGGFFWHLPGPTTSGDLWLDTPDGESTVHDGLDHINRRIAQARAGDFAVQPNGVEEGRCSRYCEYGHFCRMAVMGRQKPEHTQ